MANETFMALFNRRGELQNTFTPDKYDHAGALQYLEERKRAIRGLQDEVLVNHLLATCKNGPATASDIALQLLHEESEKLFRLSHESLQRNVSEFISFFDLGHALRIAHMLVYYGKKAVAKKNEDTVANKATEAAVRNERNPSLQRQAEIYLGFQRILQHSVPLLNGDPSGNSYMHDMAQAVKGEGVLEEAFGPYTGLLQTDSFAKELMPYAFTFAEDIYRIAYDAASKSSRRQ